MEEELLLVDVHTGKPRSVAGERQVSRRDRLVARTRGSSGSTSPAEVT